MNSIQFKSVNKILVFRTFLSEKCYTLFLTLVLYSFQLELARSNYINQKLETFERFLVMQKTLVKLKHRKIDFVKVKSRSLEIYETFIDPDAISY